MCDINRSKYEESSEKSRKSRKNEDFILSYMIVALKCVRHDGIEGVPSLALLEIDLLQELNHLIIVLHT